MLHLEIIDKSTDNVLFQCSCNLGGRLEQLPLNRVEPFEYLIPHKGCYVQSLYKKQTTCKISIYYENLIGGSFVCFQESRPTHIEGPSDSNPGCDFYEFSNIKLKIRQIPRFEFEEKMKELKPLECQCCKLDPIGTHNQRKQYENI